VISSTRSTSLDASRREPSARSGPPSLLILVGLVIMAPALLVETQAQPPRSGSTPALERFLAEVRAATPPSAHLCAVSETFVFHRARYLLYPRSICLLEAPDVDGMAPLARPAFWRDLPRWARQQGALYLLGWSLPQLPRGRVLLRSGPGVLVEFFSS